MKMIPAVLLVLVVLAACHNPTATPPPTPKWEIAADINPGAGSSFPANPVVFNNALYFSADDGSTGTELWRFNGSSASQAADIYTGTGNSSNSGYLTVYGSSLYFAAKYDGVNLSRLYKYDGTTASQVGTTNFLDNPTQMAVYNSKLFIGAIYTGSTNGKELCSFDETTLSEVKDINIGAAGSLPGFLTIYNSKLYFRAMYGTNGFELWEYNGSTDPVQVEDLNASGDSLGTSGMIVYNGALYFRATDGSGGDELYKYDGSAVSLAAAVNPAGDGLAPSGMAVYGGNLYFCGTDGLSGWELWQYNGTTAGRVVDINPSGDGLAATTYFAVFDNKLFFGATDGTTGMELYRYDGTTVSLAADINPGGGDSNPSYLAVYNSRLYFQASDGTKGAELWVYYY